MSKALEDIQEKKRTNSYDSNTVGSGSFGRQRSATIGDKAPVAEGRVPLSKVFAGVPKEEPKEEMSMFSLSKCLPKDDSSDDESSTGSRTSEDEGEPLIKLQVGGELRDSLIAHAEKQQDTKEVKDSSSGAARPFEWGRLDQMSPEAVAAEFEEHLKAWRAAGWKEEGPLPDWEVASSAWPRGDLPPRKRKGSIRQKQQQQAAPAPAPVPAAAAEPAAVVVPKAEPKEAPKEPAKEAVKETPKVEAVKAKEPAAAAAAPAAKKPDFLAKLAEAKQAEPAKPALDLDSDIDYATLPVLPDLPIEAPSIQQTKRYKNYMRLRYEYQKRNPNIELPKPTAAQPSAPPPAAGGPAKLTHRNSLTNLNAEKKPALSRVSESDAKDKRFASVREEKKGRRMSLQFIKRKDDSDKNDK